MKSIIQKSRVGAMSALLVLATAHGTAASAAPPTETLRIGYLKVGHLTPLLLVPEAMKTCNVNAQLVEFVRYADARTAMLSDSLDVASVSPADLLIPLTQGSNKIIGLTGVATSPKYLVVKKGVKINDWADLKGKRVGVPPGSAIWFQWAATLSEKGIPYNSFTSVNIQGGGPPFLQALKRGDIDAATLWEPFESQIVESGDAYFAKNLQYDQSKAIGNELGVLAATRDALTKHRDAVKCFLSAYETVQSKMAKDPDLFATSYAKFTGLPLSVTGPSSKLIKLGGTLDQAQLERAAAEFYKLGVIQKDVSKSVGTVWDSSVYTEATAKK